MSIKFTPFQDNVVLELIRPEKTKGGIWIPKPGKLKAIFAKVVAVGPGRYTETGFLIPMPVKVGDIVVFDKKETDVVPHEGKEYIFVYMEDVYARIEGLE